jgi:hypothetical protein
METFRSGTSSASSHTCCEHITAIVISSAKEGERRRNVLSDCRLNEKLGIGGIEFCCRMFALNPLKLQQPGAESDSMSADLCNWDFLQDLDFAADLEIDNNAISQIAAPHSSSHERQKERNRKAQQRARQKKKVWKVCHRQPCKRKPRVL